MPPLKDLTGQRFGRLTVLYREGSLNGHAAWMCECDCGKKKVIRSCDMVNGKSTSCGCFHNEIVAEITKSHELCGTRLYNIYNLMLQRCYNEKATGYARYGGRGITVCSEWHEPENFFKWAQENGYADNLTLERINTDGNYAPSNCRWATIKEQQNNKSTNRFLTLNGATHTVSEWSEITGISRSAIRGRLARGWTVEQTLTKEVT